MRTRQASYALNDKEKKVLDAFKEAGEALEIEEIARRAFDVKRVGASPKSKGNSWVRNSLRKLLRLKLVAGGDRSGIYKRTAASADEIFAKGEADRLAKEAKKAKQAEKAEKAEKKKAKEAKPAAKKVKKAKKTKKAAVDGTKAEAEAETEAEPGVEVGGEWSSSESDSAA